MFQFVVALRSAKLTYSDSTIMVQIQLIVPGHLDEAQIEEPIMSTLKMIDDQISHIF